MSENRLFGMYHANTPSHNKDVILQSMQKEDGVVRVVFATVEYGAHRSDLTQHSWQQLSENSDIVVLYTGLYRHRADSTQLQAAQTQ